MNYHIDLKLTNTWQTPAATVQSTVHHTSSMHRLEVNTYKNPLVDYSTHFSPTQHFSICHTTCVSNFCATWNNIASNTEESVEKCARRLTNSPERAMAQSKTWLSQKCNKILRLNKYEIKYWIEGLNECSKPELFQMLFTLTWIVVYLV